MTEDSSREDFSNTLRILVATDCHLGYMEKDEIRRLDSFQAFEEICSIAEQKQVDYLLLGGDLFHENKPSRTTLVRAIEILRRYCLNDRPVQFQVVSDQTVNFLNTFGHVNYEDPHYNVGLPVFSIHGNHDDPLGVDNLSAMDILAACNLVNYFGKMALGGSGVGQITLYPILIRKGSTSVALYGLGNIRDERLNRMFQTPHAVQWMRPEAREGCSLSDWFNIFVLHQNRIKSNPKNAINEHFLPRFLDFVIWGHEHECLIDPQEVPGMGFHVTQPGSSVATSLIEGEAKAKHVLLLEIKGSQYRPTRIPLKSVRPFEYAEVVLKEQTDIDPNDQNAVLEHLDKVVRNLIESSRRKSAGQAETKLPLVRIKVDYTGFMTINPQRFGQKFVGKVANPQDILIFSKAAKKRQSLEGKLENSKEPMGEKHYEMSCCMLALDMRRRTGKIEDSERLRPEELNQQNIEALVAESNLKMDVLPVNDLDVALHDFVNKDDKMAFYSCVQYNLEEIRNKLTKEADPLQLKEEEDLILKVGHCMQQRENERSLRAKEGGQSASSSQMWQDSRGKRAVGVGSSHTFSDDEDGDQMASSLNASNTNNYSKQKRDSSVASRGGTGKRGRGRGRGGGSSGLKQTTLEATMRSRHSQRSASIAASTAARSIAVDEEDSVDSGSSGEPRKEELDKAVDSSEPENIPQPSKGRKRAAPRGRGRGSSLTPKRGRKSDNSVIQKMFMNDDDDDEDESSNRLKKTQPQVTRNYGALRRGGRN
ncbi:double-strand break repair protein MRE11 isoform X1 [Amborella trichopoda]|uniref:double-strand break repair protein MRE11 isoform X1 n=1 Tax=Amborella trichopoda TaxID=13333 RepID=UPI0009BD0F52|nr:double-strand break repair protein MRE11 isoform X1 [Amborella trichopoda]XP_020521204.1 double-strand break repair protein MRE11 isoform X1 [Amborella trichopoda]XP_020521205.1 double-strand break repair protein MRE11 isoform X1 [Amborella trichopoda]XP_020521206.1 double-strand break repair protein MRE11 isoform X1 [Amborella trichopoda]|eukprot:XP_020521203.1 double-strand break repair protein MRE11 isoform X1 [Amborella trichopoda]